MAAPLFLLAPPRSYTSLVNAMIGQHPQAFGLPELCLFATSKLINLWQPAPEDPSLGYYHRHGLLRTVAQIYAGEQTPATIEMATHWAAAREQESSGDVFREIADYLDPWIIVEKSPIYSSSPVFLQRLYETFPDSRFIHLTRHPINQCSSVMRMNDAVYALVTGSIDYTDTAAVIDPQIVWHDTNINILEFLEKLPPEQHIRIRGEDVMLDPPGAFTHICRWLGWRDDDEAIAAMQHPERSPFAGIGPINALFGNDPEFLRNSKFRPHTPKTPPLDAPLFWRVDGKGLMPEVKAMAREFGYQ